MGLAVDRWMCICIKHSFFEYYFTCALWTLHICISMSNRNDKQTKSTHIHSMIMMMKMKTSEQQSWARIKNKLYVCIKLPMNIEKSVWCVWIFGTCLPTQKQQTPKSSPDELLLTYINNYIYITFHRNFLFIAIRQHTEL